MSLVLAVLYESNWLREDGAKLFFFGACFLAFLVLARWASSRSESSYGPTQMHEHPDIPATLESATTEPEMFEDGMDEEKPLPPARSVSFTLRTVQFKSFDVEVGPPDRESFCDEVTINLNYRSHVMPWIFTVATPKGMAAKISQGEWKSAFLRPEVMIVPRWDHDMIIADLVQRIRTELESVPEEVAEDEVTEAERSS